MNNPVDSYYRKFKKLRLSLTSRCNFACTYCVDEFEDHGTRAQRENDIPLKTNRKLSAQHLVKYVLGLHEICRFKNIRLTGGEPLLYNELFYVVDHLKQAGIEDIRITTNGFLLKPFAEKLAGSGIKKINVSLDAVDREKFLYVTKKDSLREVLNGIDAALNAGMEVKVNAVVIRGVNEGQVLPLLKYSIGKNITVRYLELMGMGHLYKTFTDSLFPEKEILGLISREFEIEEMVRTKSSTANYWKIKNSGFKFGIISNVSRPFCFDCDRLRLDSQGRLYGCISHKNGLDITTAGNDKDKLLLLLNKALGHKQKFSFQGSELTMKALGG